MKFTAVLYSAGGELHAAGCRDIARSVERYDRADTIDVEAADWKAAQDVLDEIISCGTSPDTMWAEPKPCAR